MLRAWIPIIFMVMLFYTSSSAFASQNESGFAPVLDFRVVADYPHDPSAFTQGLAFQDGHLYEGTGLYGHSSLRLVDLEKGEVLKHHDLPSYLFGEGIALWGDRILQLTWTSHLGMIYDRDLTLRGVFRYSTEGWGLTQDGQSLIMSDGGDELYFLDPEELTLRSTLPVRDGNLPIGGLNELEYVKGEIWANVFPTNKVAIIDPSTGKVSAWLDLGDIRSGDSGENVPNGIAYDAEGDRLFVTGKLWPRIYQIEVQGL